MRLLFYCFLPLLFLTGCCCIDNCDETASCPNVMWDPPPPCKRVICTDRYDELIIPESGETLTIQEVVNIALSNNPETQSAWADAKAAAYALKGAKIDYYPDATGTLTYWWSDTQTVNTLLESPIGARKVQEEIVISYLLLDFGGRSANIKIYYEALLQLNWTFNRTIQTVMINALRAYYNYLSVQSSVEAQIINVEDAQRVYDCAVQISKSGLKTHVDVLQAKSNLLSNQSALENYRGQLCIAHGILQTAMGLPHEVPFCIAKLPEDIPIQNVTENVEALIETGKKMRPDLAATYAEVEQQRADLIYQRSQILPSLSANLESDYTTYKNGAIGHSRDCVGTFALNIPLTSLFVFKDVMGNAKEKIRAAESQYRVTELQVINDIITAYYTLKTSVETYKYTVENMKYSKEAYDAMSDNYANGLSTIVDLLTSEGMLAEARSQLIAARTTWLTAVVNLAYATGSLGNKEECE